MVGKVISHYEIVRKLGAGGMGTVYEAVDQRLGRRVALKFLATGLLESPDARARFGREARAISALNHPNIGILYDFQDTEESSFLVLEYLPGGTLRDRLDAYFSAQREVPVALAVEWTGQLAAGLGHAHRKGIIHRDVKPANVLFDEEDRIKITDFGLAKLRESARLTGTGTTMGTAAYIAPEQAVGCGDADQRSDLFSVGVVLYEMLSGDLPFRADTQLGTLHKVLYTPATPLRERKPEILEELDQLVRRCLEKNADDRFQTMEELITALRPIAGVTQPWARPDTELSLPIPLRLSPAQDETRTILSPPPSPKPSRRRWLAMLLVLAALLAGALSFPTLRHWFASPPGERKLAVLLFENVGGDEAARAFADGLTETLTAAVTQLRSARASLWVVPASEIRNQEVRSPEAARRAFGVNLAVSGSIRRTTDGLQVTMNLVDVERSPARQLSSRVLNAAPDELPALERRLLGALAEMLEVEVAPGDEFRGSGTAVPRAFEHYVRGRGYLQRFDRPGNLDSAIDELELALKADPDYPLALAALGEAALAKNDVTRESSWLNQARSLNQRAAALDPELSSAFVNLCLLYTRTDRFEEAVEAGRRALELNPLSANGYRALAGAYDQAGKYAEAEQTYRSALDLQPDSWIAHKDLGVYCYHRGRLPEAEQEFRKVIELTPDNEWGYRNLGAVYQSSGRFTEAEEMLKKAVAVNANSVNLSNLGSLYHSLGRYQDAAHAFEQAVELSPEDAVIRGNLGDAHRAIPGHEDLAAAAYRQAIEIGERKLAVNRADPVLLTGLGVYSAKVGDHDRALEYITEAEQIGDLAFNLRYQCAVVHLLASRVDTALDYLERVIRDGYPIEEVIRDPEWRDLHEHPRFRRLTEGRSKPRQ